MQAPQNPSAWAYLRGVLEKLPVSTLLGEESFCLELVPEDDFFSEMVVSFPAIEMLVDIWAIKGEVERAYNGLDALEFWDPIRKGYWRYKRGKIAPVTNEAGSTIPPQAEFRCHPR